MSKKSKLLSAISAAALAVGTTHTALGGLTPEGADKSNSLHENIGVTGDSDLLVELILATGGQFTAETVCAALPGLLSSLTQENARKLPELITGIRSLGVGSDVHGAVRETLVQWVAGSPVMADHPDEQMHIAAEIGRRASGALGPYRVAAAQGNDDHRREIIDPEYSWDLDCVSLTLPPLPTSVDTY